MTLTPRSSNNILDIPQAEIETVVPAYRAADNRCRKSETVIGRLDLLHANILLRAQLDIAAAVRMDRNSRFHSPESGPDMQSYFWDGTLGDLDKVSLIEV